MSHKNYHDIDPAVFTVGINPGDVLYEHRAAQNINRFVFRVDAATTDVQVYVGAKGGSPDWCAASAFDNIEEDAPTYAATQTGAAVVWTVKGKFSGFRIRQSGAPAATLGDLTLFNE